LLQPLPFRGRLPLTRAGQAGLLIGLISGKCLPFAFSSLFCKTHLVRRPLLRRHGVQPPLVRVVRTDSEDNQASDRYPNDGSPDASSPPAGDRAIQPDRQEQAAGHQRADEKEKMTPGGHHDLFLRIRWSSSSKTTAVASHTQTIVCRPRVELLPRFHSWRGSRSFSGSER